MIGVTVNRLFWCHSAYLRTLIFSTSSTRYQEGYRADSTSSVSSPESYSDKDDFTSPSSHSIVAQRAKALCNTVINVQKHDGFLTLNSDTTLNPVCQFLTFHFRW